METKPLVSVIVYSYKKFRYLREVLESVFMQDYPYLELIIADDGSPNWETVKEKIIRLIEEKKGQNIKTIQIRHFQENRGVVKNCNDALSRAKGNYVKELGADDVLFDRTAISRAMDLMQKKGVEVLFTPQYFMDKDTGEFLRYFPSQEGTRKLAAMSREQLYKRILLADCISATGAFIQKDLWRRMGGYDERYRYMEDWHMWLRVLASDAKYAFHEQPIVKSYTGGISSYSATVKMKRNLMAEGRKTILYEIFPKHPFLAWVSFRYQQYFTDKPQILKASGIKKWFYDFYYADVHLFNCYYKVERNPRGKEG